MERVFRLFLTRKLTHQEIANALPSLRRYARAVTDLDWWHDASSVGPQ